MSKAIVESCLSIASKYPNKSGLESLIKIKSLGPSIMSLSFNEKESLNPFSVKMGSCFQDIIEHLSVNSDQIRALVITGEGRAFSAGGDMQFLLDRKRTGGLENVEEMKRFYDRFLCIRRLNVPTIAALNGHAVGAAFCFAMACDFRLGVEGSKLGVNFVKLGIHPGMGGTHFLFNTCSQFTRLMLLTGDYIGAQEAKNAGLLLNVYPNKEVLMTESLKLAEKLASSDISLEAQRLTLSTLRESEDKGLKSALDKEALSQAICYATDSFSTGLDRIMKK